MTMGLSAAKDQMTHGQILQKIREQMPEEDGFESYPFRVSFVASLEKPERHVVVLESSLTILAHQRSLAFSKNLIKNYHPLSRIKRSKLEAKDRRMRPHYSRLQRSKNGLFFKFSTIL